MTTSPCCNWGHHSHIVDLQAPYFRFTWRELLNTSCSETAGLALGEVKNYASSLLGYSSQLQAQINAAISSGRTFVLITGMSTRASQPLIDAVQSVNGIMVRFDPTTGYFTAWEF
jgi:hypothetical protein